MSVSVNKGGEYKTQSIKSIAAVMLIFINQFRQVFLKRMIHYYIKSVF